MIEKHACSPTCPCQQGRDQAIAERITARVTGRDQAIAERVAARYLMAFGVGQTLEQGTVRIHRFSETFRITDLVNAGKRGKKCRQMAVIMGYGPNKPPSLDGYAKGLAEYHNYDGCISFLKDMLVDYPGSIELHESQERGVDVMPAGFKELKVETAGFSLEVSMKDFVLNDKVDENNLPACIPKASGGLKEIPVLYRWVQENHGNMAHMTFHDMMKTMESLGVKYHYYCRMD